MSRIRKCWPGGRWQIAAEVCVFTNDQLTIETIEA